MLTAKDLKAEYRLASSGDDWGDTMHWWFTIADEIWFNRPEMAVPDDWQFRPSPMGESNDPDDYVTGCVKETPDAELMKFAGLMHRRARMLKRAGLDY